MVHICDARHRQSLQKWKSGCIVVHALASQSSRQEAVCVLRLIDVRNSLYSFMGHCLVMLREACRFCQLFWRWLICVTTFSSLHIPEGDCPLAYRFDGPPPKRTSPLPPAVLAAVPTAVPSCPSLSSTPCSNFSSLSLNFSLSCTTSLVSCATHLL